MLWSTTIFLATELGILPCNVYQLFIRCIPTGIVKFPIMLLLTLSMTKFRHFTTYDSHSISVSECCLCASTLSLLRSAILCIMWLNSVAAAVMVILLQAHFIYPFQLARSVRVRNQALYAGTTINKLPNGASSGVKSKPTFRKSVVKLSDKPYNPRKIIPPHLGPKLWRIRNIHVPIDEDPGKDDVVHHSALSEALATSLGVTVKQLSLCNVVVVKKSYDARKRSQQGFTYVVDIDEPTGVKLKLQVKSGRVEKRFRDTDADTVSADLAQLAALLREKECTSSVQQPRGGFDSNVVIVGAGPAGSH